jgi:hypothetical protein
MKRFGLLIALLCLTLAPSSAADAPVDEQVEIDGKKPFSPRADKAYILFRTNAAGYGPSFMRIPSQTEIDAFQRAKAEAFERDKAGLADERKKLIAKKVAAEKAGKKFKDEIPPEPTLANYVFVYDKVSNLQSLNLGKAVEKDKTQRSMLVEVVPGDYVLYGVGYAGVLATCFCLGTVGFDAKPGEIVDLGTILLGSASEPSDIPELAGETGFGPSMNGHLVAFTGAIRPATSSQTVPALLAGKATAPARYRAVGTFVAPGVFNINRLAAVAGVLRYDDGKVIDVASGKAVPDNQ